MTRRAISPRLAMSIFLNMRRTRFLAGVAAELTAGSASYRHKNGALRAPWVSVRGLLALRAYDKQLLPVFNRLAIRHQLFDHLSSYIRFDFVHQLHGFHNAQDLANLHRVPWLHKRRRSRRRRLVKCSDDGRADGVERPFTLASDSLGVPGTAGEVMGCATAFSGIDDAACTAMVRV